MAAAQEPPERDVKDFEFRQLCKCRVYPSPASEAAVPVNRVQLLASSSKFGLIFCASNNEIKVLRMAALSQTDQSVDARERSTGIVEAPCDKHFTVPALVVHIGISCDDMMLSVVTDDNNSRQLMIFSISAFADQSTAPAPLACHQLSSGPNTLLKDLTWNPAFPLLLAVCLSDGSVTLLEVSQTISVKAMATLPATCLSWSPKGKQIMVGKFDGSCSQHDHEFKLKKEWPAPAIFSETQQVTDMVWISTYTFLASYLPQTADTTIQPVVVMTVSNKEGNLSFINFDDVCFGSGENRQAKYYFHYLIQWEMVVMTSGAATETTIVARHLDDKTQWEHWNLEDSCRAELPVTDDQADSFPLGMSITLASQQPLQLGESKTHPPCPVLLLLSTDGVLVPFHMAFFHAQAPVLTAAPQPLPAPGSQAIAGAVGPPALAASPPAPAATQSPRSALATLLTAQSTIPSLSIPAPAPAAAAGSSQPTALAPGGAKPLFTLPPAAPSFTQPPPYSAPSSFSFTPTGGATSVAPGASGVAPAASPSSKPAFSVGGTGAGSDGSQTSGAAGFGAKPQGSTVKTNLFGAFTAAVPAPTAVSGAGATPAAVVSKLVPPAGQPATIAPGTTADTAPKLFSFGSDPSKPGGDGPSQLGPRPTGPAAGAGFGATGTGGAGFGQFSFSFKGTPTTTTPAPVSFPPPASSSVASGAGFSSPAPPSVSAPVPSSAPAPTPAAAPAPTAAAPVGTANSSFVKASATPARNGLTGVTVATSRPSTAAGGARKPEKEFDAILDSAITQNIAEEIEDFERELQNLRVRMVQSGPLVGTKAEMESLHQNTSKMETFSKEITSMTKEHCREMYDLKGSCLDMFAMAEECRCCQDRNSDPQYLRTLQQRTLDPATAQCLRRLRQAVQHIGQGLQDSDAVLDSQWEAHVEKEKKTRIRIPNCDTMYRAIKSNHNVLVTQHHELDRVQDQLRRLQIKNRTSPWENYSSYASGDDKSRAPSVMPSGTPTSSQRDWRLKKADLLTPEKVALLKESLANHRVRKVKCQPLVSLSQSRLVSVRSELRTSSVVSSDSSIQAGGSIVKEGDTSTTAAAAAGVAAMNRAEGRAGPVLTSTPAAPPPVPPGKEAPRMMQPPTSFSGVAYFKPRPTMPDVATGLPAQPGFAYSATPAGAGAIFKNPQMMQQIATAPGFGASSFSAYPTSQPASAAPAQPLLPTPGQDRFENVTPTSFVDNDETYDEDEDYAGYDEEDEEEDEEEEEVGFGDQYDYPPEDAVNGSTAGVILATPLSGFQAAAKPPGSGVSKNLFNVPASEAGNSASPANVSAFGAGAARGSYGFSFGGPSGVGSASLASSQLSGKPLFGSADTTGQDGGTKTETGDATPTASGAFGTKQEAPATGFGVTAPKTTNATAPTVTSTTGLFGLAKSTTATADSTTAAANTSATTTSKPAGGLFGFSTVPATTATSSSTGSLFGGSPPVGFFASADSTAANTTTTGGFSFAANPISSATASATTASSSVFGTSGTGSSVFGSSGSGGAFSFTSLISKAESTTTTTSGGAGGDADALSAPQTTLFGKPASFAATQPASASITDVKTETPSSTVSTTAATTPSFGGLVASATTATATPTTITTPTTATPITTTTAASVSSPSANATTVASVTSGGLLGAASTKSLFAATVASSVPASGASLFGAVTSASPGSVFGSITSASSTAPGLFGSTATTTNTSAPTTGLFGVAAATTTAPANGLFGAATTAAAPTAGLFGAAITSTTAPAPGLFGAATTTTTPAPGLFGVAAATSTAHSTGLFGSATTTTTSTGLFGSPATIAPSVGLFGSATTTTTSSGATSSSGGLFAAPAATTSGGAPSLFSTATSGGGSLFGGTPASSGGSVFGSSSSGGGQTSVFGSPATTTSSVFGASTAVPSSESASVGFEPAADSSASLGFGQPAAGFGGFSKPAFGTAPTFGQTAPGFGQSASTGGGFGQTQTPAATGFGSSGFGQTTTTTTESGSGGSFGGLFGGGGGGGGGGIFGLGAKPSEEKAKQNVFGTVQSFGSASAANNSLFGNKGPTAFGSSSPQTATSGGLFGGVSSSASGFGATQSSTSGVASMGFAVTQSTSSAVGGFGSSPAFGSSPSFGGSAFGSAPTFGGSPGFGSGGISPTTGSAFGSTPAFASPFGASQQTPTSGGFSSFAATDAPSFGSLAQATDMPTFGSMGQGAGGGFGAMAAGPQGGGGFGAQQSPGFGSASPGFGGGQQPQQPAGFGNTSFGSSPSFSSYRG